MATNGNRNAAASSHALKVGAQTPVSGENACPTPSPVPLALLNSPYAVTALMNDMPASGPITTSSTQYARDATSSRHSLANSHNLGERKECLF